jgi:peptidylprolyl isomerase
MLFCSLALGSVGCDGDRDDEPRRAGSSASHRPLIEQVLPTVSLKAPPADATKTASGLVYKKLAENNAGAQATGGDAVVVHYTGWRAGTGDTFFSTKGQGQPISIDLAHAAPAFREALQLLRKGEKAALWVPAGPGTPEALVYEVEVVDIVSPEASKSRQKPQPASATKVSK